MGVSRDTFYRYQAAVEERGIEVLFEQSRRKPNPKNRIDEQTEAAVVAIMACWEESGWPMVR